jgi:ABC-type branched-subunit amino acid transport system ATPase component
MSAADPVQPAIQVQSQSHAQTSAPAAIRDVGRVSPPVLAARGIDVAFKGVHALDRVDISLQAGTVLGLLGPNGAGKSTLLAVLSGLLRPGAGTVLLDGNDITRQPAHRRARRGLARTFQHPELFSDLTVREHLVLAARLHNSPGRVWTDPITLRGLRSPAREDEELADLVDLLGISELLEKPAGALPLGSTRLVEVGRALATHPRVLLLDEPSSGLDTGESAHLSEALTRAVDRSGVALVLVEHDVDMVLSMSDSVQVLDFGKTIAVGPPAAVREDPAVRAAYIGDENHVPVQATGATVTRLTARRAHDEQAEKPLVELTEVTAGYGAARALHAVSLKAQEGSVLAVLGANGAGKSTLARVVSGLVPATSGSVQFAGEDVTRLPAHRRRRRGIAYLPEGRAVFPSLTVIDNLRMAVRTIPAGERNDAVSRAMEAFPILRSRAKQPAGYLSGGEQQMLSLARALAVSPKLVIADEMSLGLAPKIVDEVYAGIRKAVDDGITVLLIEQFLHHALALADDCCILRRGRVVWTGTVDDAAEGALEHYLGNTDLA